MFHIFREGEKINRNISRRHFWTTLFLKRILFKQQNTKQLTSKELLFAN